MKKILRIVGILLILSMATVFAACGGTTGGTENGGNGGDENNGGNNTAYTVTVEKSDYYEVSGQTTKTTAGQEAYVVIKPAFAAVSIVKVLANGVACKPSATDANRYTFTMPAENVTVTAELQWLDVAEDNFLAWDGNYTAGQLRAELIKTPAGSGGYFTNHTEDAFSTDTTIIPKEAIKVSCEEKKGTNYAIAFNVHIDESKCTSGTTQIVLVVKNGHKYQDYAVLVYTVTIE